MGDKGRGDGMLERKSFLSVLLVICLGKFICFMSWYQIRNLRSPRAERPNQR